MGFNSGFKGLMVKLQLCVDVISTYHEHLPISILAKKGVGVGALKIQNENVSFLKVIKKFRFFEVILKEAITRYYLSAVGMLSITTLLSMLTQTPDVAMKTDDTAIIITSELAARRRATETLDVKVKATDNTEHFILDAAN